VSIRFLADENFKLAIVEGLLLQSPDLDIVRVQDVGLVGLDDPKLLAWAAQEGRILLTHDVNTIPNYAYTRIAAGLPMSGVIEVRQGTPIGQAISEILLYAEFWQDYEGQVCYVPI
jgi:hypothetical protein